MGKQKFYISMVLTVGSLAWTMYTLPGTIEQVDAAKPGSHALLTGSGSKNAKSVTPASNSFDTIPDIDAILDVARNNARARKALDPNAGDADELTIYAAQSDLSPEEQRALLEKSHRHSPSKKVAHAGGR